MTWTTWRTWLALTATAGMVAGCASTPAPSGEAFITGSASYRERLALPDNAVFEAVLEDVSRADARAVVLGQQRIGPAGNPPYTLRIAYDPRKIEASGRYAVRTSIRVNDQLWFVQDQAAPVLQTPGDNRVEVVLKRVQSAPAQPGQATPPPLPAGTDLVAPALRQDWRVTHIGGQAVPASDTRVAQIRFDDQQPRVSGNTSCNGFSATYSASGNRLQFGPIMSTKMACAGSVEREFVQALQAVRTQRVNGTQLQLLDAAGRVVMQLAAPR